MRSRIIAVAIFALAAAACSGGGSSSSSAGPTAPTPATTTSPAPAGATTVSITGQKNDQSFSPNPVPLTQGSVIVWKNVDNTVHHIVMNDGSFDSGDIGPGATSKQMVLTSTGGQYHCTLHPTTMFGSINVATSGDPGAGTPGYPY